MRPDRIVVGEVRGAEAFELTRAINAGCGFLCTLHANSARDAVNALVNAALMAGENVTERIVRRIFVEALDLVVHVDRDDIVARRRCTSGARSPRSRRSFRACPTARRTSRCSSADGARSSARVDRRAAARIRAARRSGSCRRARSARSARARPRAGVSVLAAACAIGVCCALVAAALMGTMPRLRRVSTAGRAPPGTRPALVATGRARASPRRGSGSGVRPAALLALLVLVALTGSVFVALRASRSRSALFPARVLRAAAPACGCGRCRSRGPTGSAMSSPRSRPVGR